MSAELRTVMHDGGVFAIANIVGRLAAVILIPVYTYYLSENEYVFYTVMVAVTELAAMLIGLGMGGALSRFYFDDVENPKRQSVVVSTILLAFCGFGLIVTAFSFLISPQVSQAVFVDIAPRETFGLAMAGVVLVVVYEIVSAYFLVRRRPFAVLAIAVTKVTSMIAANVVFVIWLDLGVIGILYAMIVSFAITALPFLAHILRTHGFHFDVKLSKDVLAFGLPLVPSASANAIMRLVERQLLAAQGGAAAALFGLADRIALLLQMLISAPFAKIFLVRRFETLATSQNQDELSRILNLFVVVLAIAAFGMVCFAPEVLWIVAPDRFAPALGLLPWLAVGYMLAALTMNIEFGILYRKRTHIIPIIGVAALVLSIGLNILLIPRFGAIGAAVSLVIVSVLRLIATIFANARFGMAEVRAAWPRVTMILVALLALSLVVTQDTLGNLDWSARILRTIIWSCFAGFMCFGPVIESETKAELMGLLPNRRGKPSAEESKL